MDAAHLDRSMQDLAQAAGRREAMRSLGGSGLALLAALGLVNASAKGPDKGDQARVQAAGKGKKKGQKKRKKKRDPAPTGASGSEFQTRRVISEKSNGLPSDAGFLVSAFAECGEDEKVLSCGYQVSPGESGGVDQFVNTFVFEATPNVDSSGCDAFLIRTSEVGSSAGATIQAIAVCLA